jgi:hypothetical protein
MKRFIGVLFLTLIAASQFIGALPAEAATTVTINDGAMFTSNSHVSLTLTYPAYTSWLEISNEAQPAVYPAPATTIEWDLSSGGGLKTVNVIAHIMTPYQYVCGQYVCGSYQCGPSSWCPLYCDSYCTGYTNSSESASDTITVNHPPVLNAVGNKSVDENVNLAFTLTATDPDGDTLTYSSTTLPTGATLDSVTGAFTWTPTYDQAGSFPVTFAVTDNGTPNLNDSEAITITVNNVNRAPADLAISNTTAVEDRPVGTTVGHFSTTDPDTGDTFTYTLVAGDGSADNASFTIIGDELRTAAVFDAEVRGSYSIRVRTTDAGNLAYEEAFSIDVTPWTPVPNLRLPDSDQRKCYQAVSPYGQIPCAGTGQDGEYVTNPLSYTDNADGTVTDNNTALMWQQEDDNTLHNWYQASGTYDATYNLAGQDVCGSLGLGGYNDWRLPSKKELMSIVDYAVPYPGPTISATNFPSTETSNYWSSTMDASDPGRALVVYFQGGHVGPADRLDEFPVRCVRGGQPDALDHLTDNGNGTVTDATTDLVWQQDESGAMTWESALAHCRNLVLGGGTDWRLPNIKELESISDATHLNPAIDVTYFPGAYASPYWSSTTYALFPNVAWLVVFADGTVGDYSKSTALNVRCVRGGQSGVLGNVNPCCFPDCTGGRRGDFSGLS